MLGLWAVDGHTDYIDFYVGGLAAAVATEGELVVGKNIADCRINCIPALCMVMHKCC